MPSTPTSTVFPRPPGTSAPAAVRRSLRVPRTWGFRPSDAVLLVLGNAVLIVAMWVRHGQLPRITDAAGLLTAAGQLAALLGTYAALVQVVLMSRSPWLDSLFGIDRIAGWHRLLGFATVWLITGHVIFTTAGYAIADGRSLLSQTSVFLSTYPYMLMAYVGAALFVLIAAVSIRAARRQLSHEAWHLVHFSVYLAIALAFGHEIAVGTDFVHDPVALGYWIALYAVAGLLLLSFRIVLPLAISWRHRLRVHSLVTEAPGVTSIYITGRDLDTLPMRAGQFFKFRFLARGVWWQVHPFSLSAAPNGAWLRITVKSVGDFTGLIPALRPGTRVLVEGPYGIFTTARRRQARALLVAGGIGITPLRALIEEMPQRKNGISLLYRARTAADLVFKDELDQMVSARGGTVHYIVGRRGRDVHPHPFAPRHLLAAVPDIRQRDVFVCGPRGMVDEVLSSLRSLGVPRAQVHVERFALLSA
jgi:predicted ferric reductase